MLWVDIVAWVARSPSRAKLGQGAAKHLHGTGRSTPAPPFTFTPIHPSCPRCSKRVVWLSTGPAGLWNC
jgi:hypothetical protein